MLLIHPASGQLEVASKKYFKTGALLPPLGLLYLGKILEINGHKVEILDGNAENITKDTLKKAINNCDAVGITIYSELFELNNSKNIANLVKEINPDIPLIIGGPHCTILPKQTLLEHNADICVRGLGDLIIIPVLDALMGKKKFQSISNICYRKGLKIYQTKYENFNKNLDDIPFPARYLVDKYDYGYINGVKFAKGRLTTLITSRGCAFRCNFCNVHSHIPNFSIRSADNITKEIDDIASHGYNTIVFADDNFMNMKKRDIKIMDHIIKNNLNLRMWVWGARADAADRNFFEKMRDAGVELINFGIESGSQEVLDYYNKRSFIDQMKNAVFLAREMKFIVTGTFIIGAPIETEYHINKTIKFSTSLPLDSAIFYVFLYTYKSKFWEDAVKEGKIDASEFRVLPDKNRGLGNFTTDEIMKYSRKANIHFFMNPRRWLRGFNDAVIKNDFRTVALGLKTIEMTVKEKLNQ